MGDSLLVFLKKHHPEVLNEFYRYECKDSLPKIGAIVKTLRSGFGGFGGEIREVCEYDDKYVYLKDPEHESVDRWVCKIGNWWKDLEIIEEPKGGKT